jgi:KDO2-lipid IV(A) lauroyltransferase
LQAVLFYITYPFIYLVALLPFPALYRFSNVLYYILKATGYRREVVMKNLRNSFPQKTEEEIGRIAEAFYRYLCDLIVETIKTLTMTENEAREHCRFHTPPWLDELHVKNQSIIVLLGHYGNWEWGGPAFTLNTKYQLVVIYRPLSNPYFEKMMTRMRTKFGTRITPVNNTLRDMVANRKQVTATAFIADQTPSSENAYWTTFLNQDTPVFTGPEKLGRKFNYPIVYMHFRRLDRGYYEVVPELLFNSPQETQEGDIVKAFTRRLEEEIQSDPVIWLWSHRRWKHKRTIQ